MIRKIAVVTGTRAEYGLTKYAMKEIDAAPNLRLIVIATGMHLSPQYGNTIEVIREDGFEVERVVEMLLDGDSKASMAKSLGIGISSFAEVFRDLNPDIILVVGDRSEAFAAAVTGAYLNIPIAHVQGGDSLGGATIDDSQRHALTKFAHLHFPATIESADRVAKLGEEDWRIHPIGAINIDQIRNGDFEDPEEVCQNYGFDPQMPVVLVVQHPVTTEQSDAADQMRATLDAFVELEAQIMLIYPNSDAGGRAMISEIRNHPIHERVVTQENLRREEYLGFMAAADVLVGNSSSGIIEAPSMGLPVINIGSRQGTREHAQNIIDVNHDTIKIREAIQQCLTDSGVKEKARRCENPYDMGGASEKLVKYLQNVELTDDLIRKRLTY